MNDIDYRSYIGRDLSAAEIIAEYEVSGARDLANWLYSQHQQNVPDQQVPMAWTVLAQAIYREATPHLTNPRAYLVTGDARESDSE